MKNEYGALSELINKIRDITATDEYAMEFSSGATNDEIAQFELKHRCVLPELYKEWLRFADGCCLFNTTAQLYGVAHKPFIEINPNGITGDFIRIGTFNFGDPICVSSKSQKIYQYGESIIEYADFKEFLELIIKIGVRK